MHLGLNLPNVSHEDIWQQVAVEVDDLLRELVEQGGVSRPRCDVRLGTMRPKLENLKARLGTLKQRLHEHLHQLEERSLFDRADADARGLVTRGAERLADLWLMEGLLDRLAGPAEQQTVLR